MHDILSRHGVLGSSMESRNSSISQSKDIYINDEVNVVNIIREQIETELVKEEFHENHFRTSYAKLPLLAIIQHLKSESHSSTQYATILTDMVKLFNGKETEELNAINPILMADPLTLLISYTINLYPTPKAIFANLIKMCYNLCLIKHLVLEVAQFSPNEVYAWRKQLVIEDTFDPGNIKHILGLIISKLDEFNLQTDSTRNEQCVDESVLELKMVAATMKFLKGAALLQFHLGNSDLPCSLGPFAVHKSLCDYLGLLKSSTKTPTTCISASNWTITPPEIKALISRLVEGLGCLSQWSKLVRLPVVFSRPRLPTPPSQFSKFLMQYLNVNCVFCNKKPKKAVVCLICGKVMCLIDPANRSIGQISCDGSRVGPLRRHTDQCGGTIGIYFILHDVSVVIVHNGIVNFNWSSIYLDAYNEQDYKLRSGKPLFLSMERFQYLQRIWATGGGPRDLSHESWEWWRRTNFDNY